MNGERIRIAREICGLTQIELGERVGIVQSAVAQIETGQFEPTEAVARSIALHTGFDLSYLQRSEPPIEFPEGTLLYRSRAKVLARDKAKARRMAQLAFEFVQGLSSRFRPIPISISRLDAPPTEAARITRSQLGLSPDTPIKNITNALERAGIRVFRVPIDVEGLDGFSAWVGRDRGVPMICFVGRSIAYRGRYTISEELGHLVLHTPLRVSVDRAEEEVKRFVGEFVLPEDAMRREVTSPVTLSSLGTMRHRWGASIQFLAARTRQLGITTPNQYRYLMQQISKKGWRSAKREPGDDKITPEQPQLFVELLKSAYGALPDIGKIQRDLGIPYFLLRDLLEIHGVAVAPRSSIISIASRNHVG